jgi:regulator of cell morphogenesis and NO signaling
METINNNILNVTQLEASMKHPTIFARFDELDEGETLTIHNDHDPKPLYYQLLGERGNVFKWEYTEQGPVWWKVNITRRAAQEHDETIGQIAAKDLKKAEVFKKYGLDFCCGGKKTVKEACAEKGLDVVKIEKELQQSNQAPVLQFLPYNEWKPGFLADYIVNVHHAYIRKNLPEIRGYALKVLKAHGKEHPELAEIQQLVEEVYEELSTHMVKEEKILFPYIKDIETAGNQSQLYQSAHFGTVRNPINMMEMEHEVVGKAMQKIRTLSKGFTLPEDGCSSYNLLYKMLEAFEADLYLHIHLENNILFPEALEREKQITVNGSSCKY